MKNDIFNNLPVSKQQAKIFFMSFLAMFIISSLQMLGVKSPWKPPKLTLPVPAQKADVMESIKPKLHQVPSTFTLKEDNSLIAETYAAEDFEQLSAYAVIDIDSGEIIKEKNADARLPIASLTKIMTSVVALDLADPTDEITVDSYAASMEPTKIGITPGEEMTLEELLYATLLTSANDAAQQIRTGLDRMYGEKIFINAMNEKAAFLGLENTHFANPMGFDHPENYSSAKDLARLSEYALNNYPMFAEIVSKDYLMLTNSNDHKEYELFNWNGLIGVYPDTYGIKIGNTGDAGKTTIVYSARGGKKLVAVLLGAPGTLERDLWAARLLDLGYEEAYGFAPVNVTEEQLQAKYATWQTWN